MTDRGYPRYDHTSIGQRAIFLCQDGAYDLYVTGDGICGVSFSRNDMMTTAFWSDNFFQTMPSSMRSLAVSIAVMEGWQSPDLNQKLTATPY